LIEQLAHFAQTVDNESERSRPDRADKFPMDIVGDTLKLSSEPKWQPQQGQQFGIFGLTKALVNLLKFSNKKITLSEKRY
jgi:hypothetical protein